MGARKALIVGIDPGTTVGYAVLDLNGSLLKLRSSKELELKSLVKEISSCGYALITGTDKKKCPSLVSKFAARTGARIITPKEDIQAREKEIMTKSFKPKNEHERDALAAALFGYKEVTPLLKKIGIVLKKQGKPELAERVTRTVINSGINIKRALAIEERAW